MRQNENLQTCLYPMSLFSGPAAWFFPFCISITLWHWDFINGIDCEDIRSCYIVGTNYISWTFNCQTVVLLTIILISSSIFTFLFLPHPSSEKENKVVPRFDIKAKKISIHLLLSVNVVPYLHINISSVLVFLALIRILCYIVQRKWSKVLPKYLGNV